MNRISAAVLCATAAWTPLATPAAAQTGPAERPETSSQGAWLGVRVGWTASDSVGFSLLVTGVYEGGPAHRAGLRPGDRIVGVDGAGLVDYAAWLRSIAATGPGQPLRFTVEGREGRREISLVADSRPASLAPAPNFDRIAIERARMARIIDSVFDAVRRLSMGDTVALLWSDPSERLRAFERMIAPAATPAVGARSAATGSPDAAVGAFRFEAEVTVRSSGGGVGSAPPDSSGGSDRFPLLTRYTVGGPAVLGGAVVRNLGDPLGRYFGVRAGILVTEVVAGSPALDAGLLAGDVVLSVDGRAAETVSRLREFLTESTLPVEVAVLRRGERLTLSYPAR